MMIQLLLFDQDGIIRFARLLQIYARGDLCSVADEVASGGMQQPTQLQ